MSLADWIVYWWQRTAARVEFWLTMRRVRAGIEAMPVEDYGTHIIRRGPCGGAIGTRRRARSA